jgi:hypothetical protein
MFQGYMEWTIATGSTAALVAATSFSKFQLIVATGSIFWIFDTIKDAAYAQDSFMKLSSTTLQGISAIMFTNSVISWVVDAVGSSSSSSSSSLAVSTNIGFAAVSISIGLVSSRIMISILRMKEQRI